MKFYIPFLFLFAIAVFIFSCSESETLEQSEQEVTQEQIVDTTYQSTYSISNNDIIFRGDSPNVIDLALKNEKVDIINRRICSKLFNGCCLPRPIAEYNDGLFVSLYDISSPNSYSFACDMWLNYKSDAGELLGIPLEYDAKKNNVKANGIYFECIKNNNEFWVPYFHYFHTGWNSETFDRVLDFAAPSGKLIKFRQQFCRNIAIPTTFKTKYNKVFPLEISENKSFEVYSETPFLDLDVEYRDLNKGLNDFLDFYYYKNLDNLKDRVGNAAFLIRDYESRFPVEKARVAVTPLFEPKASEDLKLLFSDFTLRAPSFDYGLYGFKYCAPENYLSTISMQNKLFTYYSEYGVNPWALITKGISDITNADGEIYWTRENLVKEKYDNYLALIQSPLFQKSINPKGHYYVMETNKKYKITVTHPRYKYFERVISIEGDSQIVIDLAHLTDKMEVVKGQGNPDGILIRRMNLR